MNNNVISCSYAVSFSESSNLIKTPTKQEPYGIAKSRTQLSNNKNKRWVVRLGDLGSIFKEKDETKALTTLGWDQFQKPFPDTSKWIVDRVLGLRGHSWVCEGQPGPALPCIATVQPREIFSQFVLFLEERVSHWRKGELCIWTCFL